MTRTVKWDWSTSARTKANRKPNKGATPINEKKIQKTTKVQKVSKDALTKRVVPMVIQKIKNANRFTYSSMREDRASPPQPQK